MTAKAGPLVCGSVACHESLAAGQQSCSSFGCVSSHGGLQNGFSFLGNISSILQQQEQAIAAALVPRTPSTDHTRGLKQVLPYAVFFYSTLYVERLPHHGSFLSFPPTSMVHQGSAFTPLRCSTLVELTRCTSIALLAWHGGLARQCTTGPVLAVTLQSMVAFTML